MRFSQLWTCVVPLTLFFLIPDRVSAVPPLTTVQDTLYKADGTRFNGVAYIEWNSFQASDASVIASSSVVVPIIEGSLRVRLVPTSNASAGARYTVRYHAEGRVQFTETWNVAPSTVPVNVASVRIANGAVTGGAVTPPASMTINDIAGLSDELTARPVKGFAFTSDRILKSGPTGALESVQGNLTDCIRVDGTTGPCGEGGVGSTGSGPSFVDQEVPTGSINGSNTVFSLAQPPDPPGSLQIYRNGIMLKAGIDYTLSGTTVTFGALSVPQTGDLLLASYRLAGSGAVSGLAGGALTGAFPAPQIAEGAISNYNIAPAAGIAESKLALLYPTHSNAFDPTAAEKAALGGTAGAPGAANKFVTELDVRLSNARAPLPHALLSNEHPDTAPSAVQRGDLITGAFTGNSAKWSRLPLGGANRCLVSNGVDAVWNTCLFTGFQSGAIPFTSSGGTLAESPLHFVWDNSNRRLSVGSNLSSSTLTIHDGAANGVTTLTVRAGQGQGQQLLQTWQNPAGIEQASLSGDGVLAVKALEAVSTPIRAAWREAGTASDPSVRAEGDAWYSTSRRARKSVEAGQIHTAPQVICASEGSTSNVSTLSLMGNCTIPAGLLQPGDRVAIRATWRFNGSGDYSVRWRWGNSTAGQLTVPGASTLLDQKYEATLFAGGAILDGQSKGSNNYSGGSFVVESTNAYATGLTVGWEGNPTVNGSELRLLQFTVIRYPGQVNP
jgi:hypothetical protein